MKIFLSYIQGMIFNSSFPLFLPKTLQSEIKMEMRQTNTAGTADYKRILIELTKVNGGYSYTKNGA